MTIHDEFELETLNKNSNSFSSEKWRCQKNQLFSSTHGKPNTKNLPPTPTKQYKRRNRKKTVISI